MFKPLQTRALAVSGAALPIWGGAAVLTPLRLSGTETLGHLYDYTVEMATVDSSTLGIWQAKDLVKPEALIGQEIEISIEFEGNGEYIPGMPGDTGVGNFGAGTRAIKGLITELRCTGADDRRVFYEVTVRPWLWLTTLNQDSRGFQNMNVVEITTAVLEKYIFPCEWRLRGMGFGASYPKRDYVRQFWTSDYDFLSVLWREWGVYFFMEGSTLVLCDSPGSHRPHGNAYDRIEYLAPGGKRIDEDHISQLSVLHRLTAGAVSLKDYDYTRSRTRFDTRRDEPGDSAFSHAEQYTWGDYSQPLAGPMGLSGEPNDHAREAEYLAEVRVDALRCRSLRACGRGNLRGLATGHTFHLDKYPIDQANAEYLVVSTTIDLRNVDETSQTAHSHAQYQCVTDFVLQPANSFFRNHPKDKPRAHPETAVVTGPGNPHSVWPDAYARVKIQFMWDREGKNDLNSSIWVRASSPWQGRNFGTINLPRVGQEVTVQYHEDDPDKPYISDRMVNQFNRPPWKLPDNLALSGTRTCDLKGNQANQFVADDTPQKLQVQVSSDYAQSRLVLGHNTRIEGNAGRKEARGEGWELATDAHGVLRANFGMLITTETRNGAASPAKDMGETVQRLKQAREQHETLSHAAVQAQALDSQDQSDVVTALKKQSDEVKGQRTGEAFPELKSPHLVMASPAGIEATTSGSTHIASGEHTALTSGGHVSVSSGSNLLASARQAIRLFAYKLGIRIVSYAEDIDIKALRKNLNLLAKLDITQTASRITISAAQDILLKGGDSYIRLETGKVTVGALRYEVNAKLSNLPPKPMGVDAKGLPAVEANDQTFKMFTPSGLALPGIAYRMTADSGTHIFQTDQLGRSATLNTKQQENVKFAVHWDELFTASE